VVRASPPPPPEWYLAYSRGGVDGYTLYHNLEGAIAKARRADVLFLGNSRTMFALPQETLRPFFARLGLRYYVLAFAYAEANLFPEEIIRRHGLTPRWVVINADPFFTDQASEFARRVMAETRFDAWKFRFETNGAFEVRRRLHRFVPYVEIAGPDRDWILFRSYEDGTTFVAATDGTGRRVRSSPGSGEAEPTLVASARRFQAETARRGGRVAFVCVPPCSSGVAVSLACALEVPLVDPRVPRLQTVDGSHLSRESARRYSQAVLAELEPVLRSGSKPGSHVGSDP
jgi:hypothetical protein